jgi:hypothetical protein
MKANVGGADRVIRIVVGVVILALGVILKSWWGLIGLVPLATGVFRFCGLYPLLGISTCKRRAEAAPSGS